MRLFVIQCLLPFAALFLLVIIPTETKVVTSMADCADFFLQQTPPCVPGILEGGNILDQNRYKPICQTLNGTRRFVTLYDTRYRIPVFSAFKYRGKFFLTTKNNTVFLVDLYTEITYQAGNTDYKNQQVFDRGHLLPSSYGSTEVEKLSTFTLTNIVPQEGTFNKNSWNHMESCIRCVLDEYCINNNNNKKGYLVIGAQPSFSNFLNNRVNIPVMLWSAFCCYSHSQMKWLASAHWGENIHHNNPYLQTMTLAQLPIFLPAYLLLFSSPITKHCILTCK
uniref:Endonuclease n=1 Tax=Acanthochromis polyacanthus TaxID=80966 RepID=A0A3Q1F0F6_9TELE